MPRALVCAQAFPPLLKQAGGVAKDYLALCRALIDGLGWHVTLFSPVNIRDSGGVGGEGSKFGSAPMVQVCSKGFWLFYVVK